VYFDTDSITLSPEAQQTLAGQAQWLNQYPQYRILIEGHADERGTREYNIGLGVQRSAGAKHFLTTRGVDPRRIKTVSFGKERPVAVCADISCWSKNRRAVTVLDTGGAVASSR
jgi:peptidoglycan-associated lipoprotein